jgi:hypothetical protein
LWKQGGELSSHEKQLNSWRVRAAKSAIVKKYYYSV